jgi:3-oxoacyl-[acyl-carrier protein] reductase
MSLFKRAPTLVRAAQPIARITETLVLPHHRLRTAKTEVSKTNAVVIDARSATSFDDLTWVHSAAQEFAPSAAFRKPGGRVVVLRREPSALDAAEAAAVSEALVGFAKSLAKETGGRGATVNVLCDASEPSASPTSDWAGYGACAAPLQWLLSNESAYVTGQELTVVREAAPELAEADRTSAVLITGAARGIGRATAQFVCRTQPTRPLVLVDHPSATQTLSSVARDLGSIGAACVAVPLDVTADEAGAAIAAAGSEAGGYGAVIHAAGVTRDKTLANMVRASGRSNSRDERAMDAAVLSPAACPELAS